MIAERSPPWQLSSAGGVRPLRRAQVQVAVEVEDQRLLTRVLGAESPVLADPPTRRCIEAIPRLVREAGGRLGRAARLPRLAQVQEPRAPGGRLPRRVAVPDAVGQWQHLPAQTDVPVSELAAGHDHVAGP